ncbi:hypothetical protein [Rossellomorea marisflavi]|uniref:hypothetical protein n=1 Tax=Rossellomorea marisflavi TaxID=189381 RepID=UPI0035111861
MDTKEAQPMLVNRSKPKDYADSLNRVMKEMEEETTNQALATHFPDWDLKPPANLIKRRSSKLR